MSSDHWMQGVRRVESPNCSERPVGRPVDMLVIHNISLPPGEFGGGWIDHLFTNQLDATAHSYFAGIAHLRVSAHILIARDGAMTQFVPFNRKAWHAGQSCFAGEENCYDFSIGIELEGCDDKPFTEEQYKALSELTEFLRGCYPAISADRVVGHSDIAPQRKTDPGPCFDWHRYRKALI
ncbi:MAG: 1,6-anhydro-N-acetylmuramyl-L-alanine amidase AmpD [Pseudohongiella sp.]|nr:1,6-anhydro-N-acetylmuramyl-L-alanine amidase AmpD [Pseudohongiella sp.]